MAVTFVRLASKGNARLIEKESRSGIEEGLQELWDEGAITVKLIERGQKVGISRQAIKGMVIRKLPTHNGLRPVIVETHVPAYRQ